MQVLNTLLYNIITTTVTVEGRNNLLNKIPPKATPTTAMTLGLVGDTNIADIDL
jgi:hypothetical protein